MIDVTSIIGINGYMYIEDTLGSGHIAYDIPTIVAGVILIIMVKALVTWLTILINGAMGVHKHV